VKEGDVGEKRWCGGNLGKQKSGLRDYGSLDLGACFEGGQKGVS